MKPGTLAICLLFQLPGIAQQVAAPTPETVGSPRGENWTDYNITNSFETGYRFDSVAGNQDEYRSSVNYGNGIRLLGSSFTMNSKDGHGRWFDELLISTQGLGGDPYESATFRIEKNRLYQYDLLWRQNDYFNPGLTTDGATGAHLLDSVYGSQDHNLTILPQSNIRFFLGYTRDTQRGTGLSTATAFDPHDDFPVFANIRRVRNEYRVGNEIRFHGLRINWIHGWEDFKDDTAYQLNTAVPSFSSFFRTEPYHGTSPYWRVGLFYERRIFNVNGRFTNTAGQRGYILDESTLGFAISAANNRQVLSFGVAQRPVTTGNLTVSVLPSEQLSIVNQTSVYNVRTEGDSTYSEVNNATQTANFLFFQYLGILTVANQTDLNYRANRWLGIYGGYHFSQRRIRSVQELIFGGTLPGTPYNQTNRLNSGVFGIRLKPVKTLTITADGEVGRNSMPFAPKSDAEYHALAARVRYKFKSLDLSVWSHADYNINSVSLSAYSSHARTYAGSASWAPLSWFAFDTSYSKLHLNTIGGIAYFVGPQFIQGDQSYYLSNIHSGNVGVRTVVKKFATVYAGYSVVQDTGDGRSTPFAAGIGTTLAAFEAAQTFPLRFQSPLVRLSFRIHEKLRFNFGYQYYGYRQDFYGSQNYRANTGYTSLLWSF